MRITLDNIARLAAIALFAIAVGGGFYYFGTLGAKVDNLSARVEEYRQEVRGLSDNLIIAVGSHEHDEKGAIFRVPIERP